jgi:hypothetical protein
MCNIHTFYHVCGHTYLRTLISCPRAVDEAIAAKKYSEGGPESPVSAISNSDDDLEALSPILSPSHPLFPFSPPPQTPLSPGLQRLNPCPSTTNSPSIVPFACEACVQLDAISSSVAEPRENRATYNLVSSCKARVRRYHGRTKSEVASPVITSPVGQWPPSLDSFEGGLEGEEGSDDEEMSPVATTFGTRSLYGESTCATSDVSASATRRRSEADTSSSTSQHARIASMRKRILLSMGRSAEEAGFEKGTGSAGSDEQ